MSAMQYLAFSNRPKLVLYILQAALALSIWCSPVRADDQVTVFAASSLIDAMEKAGAVYHQATGENVRFSFAASSTLARQIMAGAPARIFASANEGWMDALDEKGLLEPGTRISPIANSLVLVAPKDAAPTGLNDIMTGRNGIKSLDFDAILGPDGFLAVGDPAHVPAGIYAREALENLDLWSRLEDRLARADNVRSALALVARGETPLGIVFGTDARISRDISIIATFPKQAHSPIRYPFAILKGEKSPKVARFFTFLTGPEGQAIFVAFGFTPDRSASH